MMQVIGISNHSFDMDGAAVITPLDAVLHEGQRRGTRTRTLDGGVVITDGGFAHGDRTFRISVAHADALHGALWLLFQNANRIVVTTGEGAFLATLREMTAAGGEINLTIWVREILSA